MHGLMSLWFGPLVEFEADLGYFYLCPSCHDEFIIPELERIQNRILELHPAAQRHLDELESADPQQASGDDDAASATPDHGSDSDDSGEAEKSVAEDSVAVDDSREKG